MKQLTVVFDAPLHHVCLMNGLQQTFAKIPFLNRRVLNLAGKSVTLDNVVAPPPMMRNPQRTSRRAKMHHNVVDVSYWRNTLVVEYDDVMCDAQQVAVFVETLVRDYLKARHPFMRVSIEQGKVLEVTSRHIVAEIE